MSLLRLLTTLLVFNTIFKCTSRKTTKHQLDSSVVCYHPYGCFSSSGTFSHMLMLPESPAEIDPTFWLFTPGRKQPEPLLFPKMRQSPLLNVTNELYILIHGFGGFPPWMISTTEELLRKEISVIIVDWTKGSRPPNYYQAASNTRVVGALVAEMVKNLLNETRFTMNDITLVGFSLGAHVCGFAGKRLRKQKLSHIIALDPAGPLFAAHSPKARLAPSDADFVECTHTDGKSFINGGLGTMKRMGHVDFYPNGGKTQLGCPRNVKEIILDLWSLNISTFDTLACSHGRAPLLFTESIKAANDDDDSCDFLVLDCKSADDWEEGRCLRCPRNRSMPAYGFGLTKSSIPGGSFFFATRSHNDWKAPFCGHQYSFILHPDRWVRGTVWMFIKYYDGNNEIVDLVTEQEELYADTDKVKIIALSRPIDQRISINLMYRKYQSWLWSGGPDEWNLKSFAVLDFNCTYLHVANTTKVANNMMMEIALVP